MDVLELLVHLTAEHPSSMVPAFDQKNGVRLVALAKQAFTVKNQKEDLNDVV